VLHVVEEINYREIEVLRTARKQQMHQQCPCVVVAKKTRKKEVSMPMKHQ
jgi:hypothetical protein